MHSGSRLARDAACYAANQFCVFESRAVPEEMPLSQGIQQARSSQTLLSRHDLSCKIEYIL